MLLSSLRQALEGCAAGASGGSAAVVGARRLAPGVHQDPLELAAATAAALIHLLLNTFLAQPALAVV